jgi:hypothetical protein
MSSGSGTSSIAIGNSAMSSSSASSSIAIGSSTMSSATGSYNIALGDNALQSATGSYNIALGRQSGLGSGCSASCSAAYNILLGYRTGYDLSTGTGNVGLGSQALQNTTTGNYNTMLGYNSGSNVTTGSYNIVIGYNVQPASITGSNQLNIGNTITGDINNKTICIGNGICTGSNTLGVFGNVAATGTITGGVASPDYAENITVADQTIGAADVVAMDKDGSGAVVKADSPYSSLVMGVVSTHPGFITNASSIDEASSASQRPLALSGRVPVKVSTINGSIFAGDYLTASSIPGVAQKATGPGAVIGVAMESFDGGDASTNACGDADQYSCGTILFFINPSATNPSLGGLQGSDASFNSLALTGGLEAGSAYISGSAELGSLSVIGDANVGGDLTVTGTTILANLTVNGHIITGGSTPTIELLAAAGSNGAEVSLVGNDTSGVIVVTVGAASKPATETTPAVTGPVAGELVKLNFNKAYDAEPRVMITANDAASAALQFYPDADNTSFSLAVGAQPHPGAVYSFTYYVVQ